jgi:riboflavin kinase/FMN adenylyltransferase
VELLRLDPARPVRWPSPAVAVGNLDGVHLGHQALVDVVRAEARARGGTSVVLTFDPHPGRVLQPERSPRALMTLEQKAEVLAALGVERLAVLPFTRERAAQAAEDFARSILAETLGARVVAVGGNFRFGRGREGDAAALQRLGAAADFDVVVVPPVTRDGEVVSSTRVREAVEAGEMQVAAALLGRDYFVDGTVVPGDGRGRTIGFPTANVDVVNETLPGLGVYACWMTLLDADGSRLPAAVNVGRRPTFGGAGITVEAHALAPVGDLYGARVRAAFVQRLREERRFPGVEALKAQIAVDVDEARRVLRVP